jgi:hypothetical protein
MLDSSLQQILESYKALLEDVDKKCAEVLKNIPQIPCRKKCTDCCKQIFPLSLVEAWLINENFKTLPREKRRKLQSKAKKAQEKLSKLNLKKFETESDSITEIAEKRNKFANEIRSTKITCPLLNDENLCDLYEARNHDCRIHGVGFDKITGEIVGCFRHKSALADPTAKENFKKYAINPSYLYKEKSKLDSLLTIHLSQNPSLAHCYYFTTPFIPLLKDFEKENWPEFFKKFSKGNKKYSLAIDLNF